MNVFLAPIVRMRLWFESNHLMLAYCLIVIGTSLFSIKAIFIKLAYQHQVNANTLLCLRMLFSLPFYFLMLAYLQTRRPLQLTWRAIAAMSLVGMFGYYLASMLDLHALQYISVGLERMILFTYPGIVLLLSMAVFGVRPTSRDWLALAIAFIGVVIVFYQDIQLQSAMITVWGFALPEVLLGSLLCFAAACVFAVYLVNSERLIKRYTSQRFTALAMIGASGAVLAHFLINEPVAALHNQASPVYAYALAIAFFSTVLPSFLISAGIAIVGANRAGLLGYLGPVAAILGAWLFLDEPITLFHLIGFSVVLCGMAIMGNVKAKLSAKAAPSTPTSAAKR